MRRAAVAVLAAGLCWTSVACTADPGANPPTATPTATAPTTTSTSAGPTPTATTSSALQAPVMPALARENTRAGAKAFVRYYATLINYAWKRGSTRDLRKMGSPGCGGCQAAANGIDEVVSQGGYRRGAEWRPLSVVGIPLQPPTSPILNVAIHVKQGSFRESGTTAPRRIDESTNRFDFHLRWGRAGWVIEKLVTA